MISGECSTKMSRLIFRARSQTLDVKSQRKWQYNDRACIGCKRYEETGQEIMICENLNNENRIDTHPINYSAFFEKNLSNMVKAAILVEKGLKRRQMILEIGIT